MQKASRSRSSLLDEIADLHARLDEAEETICAIRSGDVDAAISRGSGEPQLLALQGQDAETNRFRGEMLAHVSDAVIAVDQTNRLIYLNAAAERLYGLVASSALSRIPARTCTVRWLSSHDEAAALMALRDSGEWHGENVHVRQDGRELSVESSVTLLRDDAGRPAGMLAVIRDVTKRKQQENKVVVSEVRYRRLFEAAHDGILILNPDTRKIVDANPFMTRLLGYSRELLLGKELYEIGLLGDEAASRAMVEELKQSKQVRYENLPLKNQSGKLQEVEVIANLYDENDRPVIQCNIRDITERKRAEEQVRLLMAEVNHRAKNLLAVVQAVARQTARHGDPATFAERLSDRIGSLAAGQDLLVKNQWHGVEVAELVVAQLAHFKELIGKRVQFSGPSVELSAAAAQGIGMALHELATNAIKYGALSNGEGRVEIVWDVIAGNAPEFSISWHEDGGPKVRAPAARGFGQTIIGRMAEASVQGTAEISYDEAGLSWTLSAPLGNALATRRI